MKFPLVTFILLLAVPSGVMAQREPHAGYIYPAGGRQGTTFQATVGGRYLDATAVICSGEGVSATVVKQERQVTPAEQSEMRETLAKIQEKRKQREEVTSEEAKAAEEIKQKLVNFGRRLSNPSLGEFVTLTVTVTPKALPGNREIRLVTPSGLSNPLIFHVGDLPELSKPVWKDIPKSKSSMEADIDPKPPEKSITLPVNINGQIPPGGVDRYRFHADAGQQWVVVVRARELIPYIPDAVPGWFQATIALYDANGHELAYIDDYGFHPDPVMYYKAPATGDYVLEVKDALYRGREDFVYRITVGELPFVTGIFPLGGKTGTRPNLSLTGWNLQRDNLLVDLQDKGPGIYSLPREQLGNRVLVAADTLPEALEREPNNSVGVAQQVSVPIILNGHIDEPGDMDVFRFDGKQGDQVVIEVFARRLDSPVDSMLAITDAAGKQLAFNDDHEDKGSGLDTHHADSHLMITLPATGSYFVHLGDTQHGGGPAFAYRLRISGPRPDFQLRVTPSSLNVHGNASVPVTIHALRKDGFTGEISLRLKDAPKGFGLTGARIPPQQDQIRCTLDAAVESAMDPFSLQIEGSATIHGHEIVHAAVPADDVMQAFAYRHLMPAQELKVAIFGRFRPGSTARILSPTPVKIPTNGNIRIGVVVPAGPRAGKIGYELSEAPPGISIKDSSPTWIVLQADAAKVKPGTTGNLIVKAFAEPPAATDSQSAPANNRRIPLGALPAISFEIVPPEDPQPNHGP